MYLQGKDLVFLGSLPENAMRQALLAFTALVLTASTASAAVFQYRLDIPRKDKKGREFKSPVFLWIPPQAKQVRGVVMSGMTVAEREFSRDPVIRAACASADLAMVFSMAGLRMDIQKLLNDLATRSGIKELSTAPLFFLGHSAGGWPARHAATKYADRCFGLMQFRGGLPGSPGDKNPVPPGVPCLVMVGQFDEHGGTMRTEDGKEPAWTRARDQLAGFRGQEAGNLVSLVVEPGAGHFAWSDRNAAYMALFIKKASAARIPKEADASKPVVCTSIDPKTGWLSDLAIEKKDAKPPAAHETYTGDKAKTAWHFDEEIAKATVAFHADLAGKKDQFINWKDNVWVDIGIRPFFGGFKWVSADTFQVHPFYTDTYPKQAHQQAPNWAKKGQPCGKSDAPIKIKVVAGPLAHVKDHLFRIEHDATAPAGDRVKMYFMAYSEGNGTFRYTEKIGMGPRGGFRGLRKGKDQTISFPEIADVKADAGPIELKATSDAGLKVRYYVAYGPARIKDGKLVISELPVRAQLPIEVAVTAYQAGSAVKPQVKAAKPVTRRFRITK